MITERTETIKVRGVECTLHVKELAQLNSIHYLVAYPGGLTTVHRGVATEDDGSLRASAIREADAILWERQGSDPATA